MPVEFGELPEKVAGGGYVKWEDEAAVLRERPGDWALLVSKPTAVAARNAANGIKRGTLQAFRPAGHFEAAARGTDVWVCYVGEGGGRREGRTERAS